MAQALGYGQYSCGGEHTLKAHMKRASERLYNEQLRAAAVSRFTPTHTTYDPTIRVDPWEVIPPYDQLGIASNSTDGSISIIRKYKGKRIPLAIAHPEPEDERTQQLLTQDQLVEVARTWLDAYYYAGRAQRAAILDVNDPMEYKPTEGVKQYLENMGLINTSAAPTGKVRMVALAGTEGVKVGGTPKVKRITWNGHSGFSLARYCGSVHLSAAQAIHVFQRIGMRDFGKSAIIGGVYAGKSGTRGDPARLTPEQAKIIQQYAAEVPPEDKTAPTGAIKVEGAAPTTTTIQSAHIQPVQVQPKLSKLEKQRIHDLKVMEEMKKRRAAGKR